MNELKQKRTWAYLQSPRFYEVAPCKCGNQDTQWSEYEKHVWCAKCEIEFIPEHGGVFDNPIPINTAQMMGLDFTKVDLLTNDILVLNSDNEYVKCLNFADCFESQLIPVNLKNFSRLVQEPKIAATAHLNYKSFLLESIVKFDSQFELDTAISTEIIFKFLNKNTFKLDFRLSEGIYKLQDTLQSERFKAYIMHEHLQAELGGKKISVSIKI